MRAMFDPHLPAWAIVLLFALPICLARFLEGAPNVTDEDALAANLLRDPPLAATIPGSLLGSGQRFLIVCLSGCACEPKVVQEYLDGLDHTITPVFVLPVPDDRITVLRKAFPGVDIRSDPSFEKVRLLNPCFLPRSYLIYRGRLIWKQNELQMPVGEVNAATLATLDEVQALEEVDK